MNLHRRLSRLASRTKTRFLKRVGLYKPTTIHTSYIICATQRSGSTLLCEALKNSSVAGRPIECFTREIELELSGIWGVSSFTDYFEKILEYGTTPNGIFGTKIMLEQFAYFISEVRKSPKYNASNVPLEQSLTTVFPNLHYIWITRRDKVRQAVSFEKALNTEIFEWQIDKPALLQKELTFNFEHINTIYYRSLAQEVAWQKYFAARGVTPFKVVYEDFVDNYEQTIKDILNYLKISIPNDLGFHKRKLIKMADAQSDEWVERYLEIKRQRA